jgi:hypothetical protein
MLVLGSVLAGLTLAGQLGRRVTVLQAARDIEVGQVVGAGDLQAVDVAVDSPVQMVAAQDQSSLVGLTATGRLPAGSLVSPADFEAGTGLAAGQVVIGAVLAPGELPRPDLRVGDRVRLIQVAGASAPASGDAAGTVVLGEAKIFSLTGGSNPGTASAATVESSGQFVSLAVAESLAGKVAQASAGRALRLVYLPGGGR